jgi:riboflavin synthase
MGLTNVEGRRNASGPSRIDVGTLRCKLIRMYSGITRGLFPIVAQEARSGVTRLTVELSPELAHGVERGASIALDGVCLTVVDFDGARIAFEAVAETLSRTTLGDLRPGSLVSVERSVRVGDELGGHDVFGHVIGTATIRERKHVGEQLDLVLQVPSDWLKYILPKGFIALDGSSLTVGSVWRETGLFDVHLIPETQRLTKLGHKETGERVNVELDPRTVAIVDTVERVLAERTELR